MTAKGNSAEINQTGTNRIEQLGAELRSIVTAESAMLARAVRATARMLTKRFSYFDEHSNRTEWRNAGCAVKVDKYHVYLSLLSTVPETVEVALVVYRPVRRGDSFVGALVASDWQEARNKVTLDEVLAAVVEAMGKAAKSQITLGATKTVEQLEKIAGDGCCAAAAEAAEPSVPKRRFAFARGDETGPQKEE